MVLVTGFGPFGHLADNPSAALARAVNGRRVRGHTVIGRVLPVSYARGPAHTLELARWLKPALILGTGVAAQRSEPAVEEVGDARLDPANTDVDGVSLDRLEGPDSVAATVDVAALAGAIEAPRSRDAGGYVCNAWLYRVASQAKVPVGFVHIPLAGLAPERLLAGIAAAVADL